MPSQTCILAFILWISATSALYNSSDECGIDLKEYFNEKFGIVQLNVTIPKNTKENSLQVMAISSKCSHLDIRQRIQNVYVLVPKEKSYERLEPGCEYIVSIPPCSERIVLKDCQPICNCHLMKAKGTIDLQPIHDTEYNISWSVVPSRFHVHNVSFSINVNDMPNGTIDKLQEEKISPNVGWTTVYIDHKTVQKINAKFIDSNKCMAFGTAIVPFPKHSHNFTIVWIVSLSVTCALALFFVMFRFKGKTLKKGSAHALVVNPTYITFPQDSYEVDYESIKLEKVLGEGEFGIVYLGQVGGALVAVKTLKEQSIDEERQDLLNEIALMKKIGRHPNVVAFVGCCTSHQRQVLLLEYVPHGNLRDYLHKLRDEWSANTSSHESVFTGSDSSYILLPDGGRQEKIDRPSVTTQMTDLSEEQTPLTSQTECALDSQQLHDFALQIARGMAYLEGLSIVHRDLAARNVLLAPNKILKISDFGMSKRGPYVNRGPKKEPIRWMSIEAIEARTTSSKSDVWSFGVVLWEIGTLGAFPYVGVSDVCLLRYLQDGLRLDKPRICTDELYAVMSRCWRRRPEERPTFRELVDELSGRSQNAYVNFGDVEKNYVFPAM